MPAKPSPRTHIALLRGVNVGQTVVSMDRLRASFAGLGFGNVRTYIQSGNVIFETANSSGDLSARIEQRLLRDFGVSVPVLLKTPEQLAEVVRRNPFLRDGAVDRSKLHVTFLSAPAPPPAREVLQSLAAGPEQVRILGREIYLYCPNGYGRTKLSNAAIEKKLWVVATTRNWNTVNTLLAMAHGTPPP
jgi:uncharacterized protein (DUF1697 family)